MAAAKISVVALVMHLVGLSTLANAKCPDDFGSNAKCQVADSKRPFYDTSSAIKSCQALLCTPAECCLPHGLCPSSLYNDNAKCVAAAPTLPLYDVTKAATNCLGVHCLATECCISKGKCGTSLYNDNAKCVAAANTLPFYDVTKVATDCVGVHCLATECCISKEKCGKSPYNDNAKCAVAAPKLPFYDTTKGHTLCVAACKPEECCSSKEKCGNSDFSDDAKCKGPVPVAVPPSLPFYDTTKATTDCKGTCVAAECCSLKQKCGDSPYNDAACQRADLALPFYDTTKVATECKATCSALECCSASSSAPAACFPGDAKVVVHGLGSMPLHSLRIGDGVLVGTRQFEPVLSLLHMDVGASTATAEIHLVRGATV